MRRSTIISCNRADPASDGLNDALRSICTFTCQRQMFIRTLMIHSFSRAVTVIKMKELKLVDDDYAMTVR